MKIVCPSCEATYQVPEAVHESRRAVRCARCGNSWVPGDSPRIEDDEAVAPAAPAPAAAAKPEAQPAAMAPAAQAAEPPAAEAAPAGGFASAQDVFAALEAEAAAAVAAAPAAGDNAASATDMPSETVLAERPAAAAPALRQNAASALGDLSAPLRETPAEIAAAVDRQPAPEGAPLSAWISSMVVLVGLFVAFVVAREPIMALWPASQRIYAAMGLFHP